jgi:isoleucyl-tRNA synthetase
MTAQLDEYDLFAACATVRGFLDALTNWYVRRSRDRFWAGDQAAIDTLHTVLSVLCRVAAPLLPLTTEAIYRGLTGERSVHLTDWPDAASLPADPDLVATMDLARDVCNATLRIRKAHHRRVRLPLATLTVAVPDAGRLDGFTALIADEVNVKEVVLTDDVASVAHHELQVVPAALGPRLAGGTQAVIKAVKAGDWRVDGDHVVAGGVELQAGEYQLKLVVAGDGASTSLSGGAGVVVLDTHVTPELEAEGVTRDLVRLVQQARRDADLAVSDRIDLVVELPMDVRRQVEAFQDMLAGETLAVSIRFEDAPAVGTEEARLDGHPIRIRIRRA